MTIQPAPLVTGAGRSTNSTGATHTTKVEVQAGFQAVIAGLLAFYQPTDTFHMSDGLYTRDELIARFQAFVLAVEKTKSDYQLWRTDVATEQALLSQVQPLRAGMRGIVQARFGKQAPQVLQFGFTPVKPAVRSAASRALSARKAVATRKARGTVGKKEKLSIHGTVPAAIVAALAPQAGSSTTPLAPATPPVEAPAPTPPGTNTPQH